jgi:hypothetical protein
MTLWLAISIRRDDQDGKADRRSLRSEGQNSSLTCLHSRSDLIRCVHADVRTRAAPDRSRSRRRILDPVPVRSNWKRRGLEIPAPLFDATTVNVRVGPRRTGVRSIRPRRAPGDQNFGPVRFEVASEHLPTGEAGNLVHKYDPTRTLVICQTIADPLNDCLLVEIC